MSYCPTAQTHDATRGDAGYTRAALLVVGGRCSERDLESDRDNVVRAMVLAFPSLVKPITETNVVPQIKLLITNEAKSTVPTVASALRYV